MFIILVVLICVGGLTAQVPKSSQEAAILKESRYLNTAGQFGSSYLQEDGIEFNEEADSEGNRKGSYTYIDTNGQRRTVTYTAGKEGFHAVGDHLPVAQPAALNSFPAQVHPNHYPVPVVPQVHKYQIQPQVTAAPSHQVQFQPGHQPINLFQFQDSSVISTTDVPILRHYPPGKLSFKQSSDGFSYTFNSIVSK